MEYPYSESFEGQGKTPQAGDRVIVANKYISPEPFEVVVLRVIKSDRLSGGSIVDTSDCRFLLSVVYEKKENESV